MTRKTASIFTALLFFSAGGGLHASADQTALIDALVRKKILTADEGNALKADISVDEEKKEEAKVRLSDSIKELRVGGSLKMRYQGDRFEPLVRKEGERRVTERSRFRYRLRLGFDFILHDNWFGGVGFVSSKFADSGYQTFGGGFRNDELYISRAFIGWNASDWTTFVFGKQANPFFTSDLVWDKDINPAGMVEELRLGDWWYGPEEKEKRRWDVTLVAGQLFFVDNTEWQTPNAYLFEQQVIFEYNFDSETKVTVAPAFLFYHPGRATGAANAAPFSPESDRPLWINEASALTLIQVPGELKWEWHKRPLRLEWDFTYNTEGSKRMHDIYGIDSHSAQDDFSFLVGMQYGETKRKGDFAFYANYRQVGMAAIDPNINDSTFALSRLNMHGFKLGASYNFTDAVVASVTYTAAWRLRNGVRGGQATEGAELANARAAQGVQVDLDVKF